jgi:predicted transcriptional regulator
MNTKRELTKAEEQIMQAIWQVDKGFAKDILEVLPEPKPAYNTVLTVIHVLVNKGFVKFNTYGKSNEYYPTISKNEYSMGQLQSLKKRYFNNSSKQMLSFFLKENKLEINDVDEILKMIKDDNK